MTSFFLDERISLGTSSLLKSILGPGSILSRLEREKDCGDTRFQNVFQELRQLLGSFADMMLLNDGRCLDDVLLELQFHLQPKESFAGDWDGVVNVLSRLNCVVLWAEDVIEMGYTEIALHQQDWKQEAAATRMLRLALSKGKYRGALDTLRSGMDSIVHRLRDLLRHAPAKVSSFIGYLPSLEGGTAFPQEDGDTYSRGMDSDLDVEILALQDSLEGAMTQTIQFHRPVDDAARTWPRDADLNAIIMRLLSMSNRKNDKAPVLPIIGMPGVGKTTLASLIYYNDHVRTHFRRRLWLNVANGFNLDLIAQAIEAIATKLRWIPDQQEVERENPIITGNDTQRRIMKIFGRNAQHRYLIILDGLKYEDRHQWLAFREFLKGTNNHVIITTRHGKAISEDFAASYVLQGLPELYSWEYLLDNKLLGKYKTSSKDSKPLPRFIARAVQCSAGVPSALNILRGYMYEDPRYLNCEEIIILRLSHSLASDMHRDFFVNLPDHLRNCFAYCSLFPPGYEMDKSTLIQLWMAQGFIPTQSDSDAEDLGGECFMDLLERLLLSEPHTDEFGNIKSCKMHKLMHDLSLLIASRIINKDWLSLRSRYTISWNYDHVSQMNNLELDSLPSSLGDLRTLLFLDQEEFAYFSLSHPSPEERIEQKMGELTFLRVFDFHQVNIKRVPTSINEMKLLRYLDLSGNPNLIMLPDSITWLIHLQTLKLSHCEKLKELPKDIVRLKNLRHLEIVGCLGLTHMPCRIGQMTTLRTLSMFVVSDEIGSSPSVGELSELKALNHLRGKLELRHLEKAGSSSLASLDMGKKEYLQSIALEWEATDADNHVDGSSDDDEKTLEALRPHQKLKGFSLDGYRGVNFPKWISSLCNLVKIMVNDCHRCRSLPPLYQLPRLKYLILENMDSLEYIISDISTTTLEGFHENNAVEGNSNFARFFPSLTYLCLRELPHLKGWLNVNDTTSNTNQILSHSFPAIEDLDVSKLSKKQLENLLLQFPLSTLKFLCISYVMDLDYLPETLFLSLSSIQNLEMQYCPNLSCLPTFLVSLKSLSIVGCDGLTSLPRDLQRLTALETLKLKYCFKLNLQMSHNHVKPDNDIDLKWWPQFDLAQSDHGGSLQAQEEPDSSYFAGLKSLSYLEIKQLPKLVSLPDSMCKLTSLQRLCLSGCDNLVRLPKGMWRIRHLYKIKIDGCPLLRERCRDKTSEEWKNICNIRDCDLDWDEDQISIESLENPYKDLFIGY